MKSPNLYAELELITPDSILEVSPFQGAPSWKARAWQVVVANCTRLVSALAGSSEPHISLRYTAQGVPYYNVYDPTSGQVMTFSTAQEVRVWLEQRYSAP